MNLARLPSVNVLLIIILKSIPSASVILFESLELGARRCWTIRDNLSTCPIVESADSKNLLEGYFILPLITISSKGRTFSFNVRISNTTIIRQVRTFAMIKEEAEVDIQLIDTSNYHAIKCNARRGTRMNVSSNILPSSGAFIEYRNLYSGYPNLRKYSTVVIAPLALQSGHFTCRSTDDRNYYTEKFRIFPQSSGIQNESPFVSVRESTIMSDETAKGFVVPCRTNYRLESPPFLLWKKNFKNKFTMLTDEEMGSFRWDPTVGFHFKSSSRMWENEILACQLGNFLKEFAPTPRRFHNSLVVEAEENQIGCIISRMNVSSNLLAMDSELADRKVRYHVCDSDYGCDLYWEMGLLDHESRYQEVTRLPLIKAKHRPLRDFGILSCSAMHLSVDLIVAERSYRKFYVGFDSNVYLLPGAFPASSVIQISQVDGIFYKNHTLLYHEFTCTTVTFVMSQPVYLILRHEDLSETVYADEVTATVEPSSIVGFNVALYSTVTHAICLCLTNKGKVMSAERAVKVVDATAPFVANTTTKFRALKVGGLVDDQALICPIAGAPPPRYQWIFDEKSLMLTRGANTSILAFRQIDEALAGKYTCVASNEYGSTSFEFQVSVQAPGIFSTLSRGTKVGILFLVLIVLIVFFAALFLTWKYRMSKDQTRNLPPEEAREFLNGVSTSGDEATCGDGPELALNSPFTKIIEPKSLVVARDEILGKGQYGIVYRGVLDGEPVAVKTFKQAVTYEEFRAGLVEVKLMSFVGTHPNIVKFIGADVSNIGKLQLLVVMELSPIGSLEKHLRRLKPSGPIYANDASQYCNNDERSLRKTLFGYCEQIAFAMEHLESKRIVHGDLAARNVLVFSHGVVKVTDFGYSRQLYENSLYKPKNNRLLPWRWASIELLQRMEFSTESDIWAFGVTIWEVFTFGNVPFASLKWNDQFMDSLEKAVRLKRPQALSMPQYSFVKECWNVEKSLRPKFSALKSFFSTEKGHVHESVCDVGI